MTHYFIFTPHTTKKHHRLSHINKTFCLFFNRKEEIIYDTAHPTINGIFQITSNYDKLFEVEESRVRKKSGFA